MPRLLLDVSLTDEGEAMTATEIADAFFEWCHVVVQYGIDPPTCILSFDGCDPVDER